MATWKLETLSAIDLGALIHCIPKRPVEVQQLSLTPEYACTQKKYEKITYELNSIFKQSHLPMALLKSIKHAQIPAHISEEIHYIPPGVRWDLPPLSGC